MTGVPLWVRVSGIIGLVLVVAVVGSMALGSGAMPGMHPGGGGMDHRAPGGSAAPPAMPSGLDHRAPAGPGAPSATPSVRPSH